MKKFQKDLFFTVMVIVLFFLSSNAYAQDNEGISLSETYESTVDTVNLGHKVDNTEYNSARSQAVNANTAASNAIIFLAPQLTTGYAQILESDTITPDMKRGLYGMVEDGVYAMYRGQPTINVYAHLADEWVPGYQNTSVYAADSGYKELQDAGVDEIWSVVRNITYVFFILIMIVVGFMIMFRSKLGGQTLVTLGNTLPNIIVALIAVTFSFAIAGLLIDFGGLLMNILNDIFETVGNADDIVGIDTFGHLFKSVSPSVIFKTIGGTLKEVTGGNEAFLGVLKVAGGVGAFIALLTNPVAQGMGLTALLLVIVIVVIGTVGVFKVMITLIKAYLGILLHVITAPFQIAISAIPGKKDSLINWGKNVLRNVLVYPVTFAILNIPMVLYEISGGELSLPGPDKLTLGDGAAMLETVGGWGLLQALAIFIVQILVLFIASNADKYVQAIIPPTVSRYGTAAGQAARESVGKIPLLGKLLAKQ